MGASSSKTESSNETESSGETKNNMANERDETEATEHLEKYGVSGLKELFISKLEKWKETTINIGITGDSGVGKSSFVNAIRGVEDDDKLAAPTGVNETTREASEYPHPLNTNTIFWDLPGIGTPNYPNLETYRKEVELQKYDAFLILSANRFKENDLQLARELKSLKKPFFFIRTKIDQDVDNQKRRKKIDEKTTLKDIWKNCLENLKSFGDSEEIVFLISSHETTKWDFARLEQAILDVLPQMKKESLTLSLNLLTTQSEDMLKRKTAILRDRIWQVATASGFGALIPLPGFSFALDIVLIVKELDFYMSQLGLPRKESSEFLKLSPEKQNRLRSLNVKSVAEVAKLMAVYGTSSAVEEASRFVPILGTAIAGSLSFSSTYFFLKSCLDDMEKIALEILYTCNVIAYNTTMNDVDDIDE